MGLELGLKQKINKQNLIYIITICHGLPHKPPPAYGFFQLLKELQNKTDAMQIKIIKAAGENDLRIMLISRYPLKLTENPNTKRMTELVRKVDRVSPNIKRIIERVGDSN